MLKVTYCMFQVTRTRWTLPVTCWKLNFYKCGLLSVAAVECWMLNEKCCLWPVECWMLPLHDSCCLLHDSCCLLHDACWMLPVAWCMLHDACCMMHDAWRMLHDTSCMMHVAHWMLYNYKIVYAARCMIAPTHESKLYAYIFTYHDSYIPCKLRSFQYFSENLYVKSISAHLFF